MTDQKLKIGFMGTPDFALAALKILHESGHDIVCVYTQPPRPKGRGQQVQPSPVHTYAQAKGIPVFTPKTLKASEAQAEFAAQNLDVAIVAAYGLILPKAVLDAPRFGCLNIHASLLPRWRGASPIQRAIWANDAKTGISIMQMDEGLDTGPVITARGLSIDDRTTTPSLHDDLSTLGAEMIVEILSRLAQDGGLKSEKQDDARATHAPRLTREDGRVDWGQNAATIDRQIRALNPWPGVWTEFEGQRIKILEASLSPQRSENQGDGAILDREGHVACGENTILRLEKIQPDNAKPMDFSAAINGGYIKQNGAFS